MVRRLTCRRHSSARGSCSTSRSRRCSTSDTPNFAERSKVYALGELWLSYANGDDEGPLLAEPQVAT